MYKKLQAVARKAQLGALSFPRCGAAELVMQGHRYLPLNLSLFTPSEAGKAPTLRREV